MSLTTQPAHLAWARWLLLEQAQASEPAAALLYDRLHDAFAPLIGATGVQLLLMRCATAASFDLAALREAPLLSRGAALRARLARTHDALALEDAVAFYGTFFSLLARLIGERLTHNMLKAAWPALSQMPPPERNP